MCRRTKRILASGLVLLAFILALLSSIRKPDSLAEADKRSALDQKSSPHPLEETPANVHSSGRPLLVEHTGLNPLPNIASSDGTMDDEIFRDLGIPQKEREHVAESVREAFAVARRLREIATQSLHFKKGQRVAIPPLSERELSNIVQNFVSSLNGTDVSGLVPLLHSQLKNQFGRKMWATFEASQALTLSHYAHTPEPLIGMVFNVEIEKGDGSLERFSMNPVQGNRSEFFFLNALR